MGRNTRLTPYDDRIGEEFDEEASVAEFMSYRSAPSKSKGDYHPDEAMPLFLSDHDEEPKRPSFGRVRGKAAGSPRFLKASVFAALAAAILLAILSVENPLTLFANAKASLVGTSAGLSGASQTKPAPGPMLASAEQSAPEIGIRALPPTSKSSPSRDEIAAAFKTAHQGQPEVRLPPAAAAPAAVATASPAPAAAAPPATRRLDADELAALLKRAKSLIAIGDIAPARLLLKRAADAQEASAALLLAQTYDPAVLGKQDMRSITPDPALARDWYQKAARYGSLDAQQRLTQMQN